MILKFILQFQILKERTLLTAAFAATTNNGCDENLI